MAVREAQLYEIFPVPVSGKFSAGRAKTVEIYTPASGVCIPDAQNGDLDRIIPPNRCKNSIKREFFIPKIYRTELLIRSD